jgi:hypothetical protein
MDDLDSKMEAMRAQFEREADQEGSWTSYNASLGRPLLDSAKFLKPKAKADPVHVAETASDDRSNGSHAEDRDFRSSEPGNSSAPAASEKEPAEAVPVQVRFPDNWTRK